MTPHSTARRVKYSNNSWMMPWKRCERKRSWPTLEYYSSIFLKGLRRIIHFRRNIRIMEFHNSKESANHYHKVLCVCVCVYIYVYKYIYIYIYIYIKIYCTEIHGSTCWVTKLFLQPIYNIITSCIHVSKCKTHQCFNSVK